MNTKKRSLSLILVVCLAVSMMLAMTACGGKKSLEDYMNGAAMQKVIDAQTEQYKAQNMDMKMYAQGDDLHMDVTMTTISAADASLVAGALEDGLAGESQTFVDMANQMKDACSNSTVNVVVTYYASDGTTVLATQSFASDK